MNLDRLQTFFETSPAAKLMRSPHAAHIVFFLFREFKEHEKITLRNSELIQRLSEFLDNVHETDPEILRDRAEAYLSSWSTGDSRWLRRFWDATHAEPVFELTPHTEDVLTFLAEALDRTLGFVGTESRLKRIIDTLSDIVVRGSSDPSRRLEHLRAERDRLDSEISAIESGAAVSTYSSTAIRERFADAVSELASLQGDFRAVEDSFKSITRSVQKKQAGLDGSRGDILGFALAEEDSLKHQDQGVSFDEFVRLVLSPSKQDQLEILVSRLDEIDVLVDQVEGMRRVRGMIGSLSEEAEKVLRTTRRLSSTLRRLLDSRVTSVRLRLASVLREIRGAAVALAERAPDDSFGIDVVAELDLVNASERTFWTAPARFESPPLKNNQPDEDDRFSAFRNLAALQRLDWQGMRQAVADMLRESSRLSLPDLLSAHPPKAGAIEILGYVQIAHDDGHYIDSSITEIIRLPYDGTAAGEPEEFEIPRVIFLSEHARTLVRGLQIGEAR